MSCSRYFWRGTVAKHFWTWFCLAWKRAGSLSPSPFSWAAHMGQGSEGNIWLPPDPVSLNYSEGSSQEQSWWCELLEGELLPSCLGFAVFVGVMSSFCEVCAPRPPGKQNRGTRPECQMQKTSRSDSSYPPSPFCFERSFQADFIQQELA